MICVRRSARVGILLSAGALVLSACGAADVDDEAAASSEIDSSHIDAALEFTGGTAGEADSSLEPVKVGFVNQEGGVPAFPEYRATAEAAVKFVNEHLGGIDSRPIEMVSCIVQAEEDGQRCAAEFLADDVVIANWMLGTVGNQSFYRTIDGEIPVIVSVPASLADSTSPHVYEFDGGALSTLNAMSVSATNEGEENVAIVSTGNPSGRANTGEVQIPMLEELGATTAVGYYDDAATGPEMVSAVQASGATTADSIVLSPATPAQCNLAYDAFKQLGITTKVVASAICDSAEVIEHTGGGPEGWVFASFASNAHVESDIEGQTYKNVLESYGAGDAVGGYTIKTFGDVLAVAQFGNEIGADAITAEAFDQAIVEWNGPAFAVPGEMNCGYDKEAIGICGSAARMSVYEDGQWKSLDDISVS